MREARAARVEKKIARGLDFPRRRNFYWYTRNPPSWYFRRYSLREQARLCYLIGRCQGNSIPRRTNRETRKICSWTYVLSYNSWATLVGLFRLKPHSAEPTLFFSTGNPLSSFGFTLRIGLPTLKFTGITAFRGQNLTRTHWERWRYLNS